MKGYFKKLPVFILLLIILLISFLALKKIQVFLGKAEKIPQEVIIDGASPQILTRFWQNFSQGGEEMKKMLEPIGPAISALQPEYIRIDHLYDFYQVVDRNPLGELIYNWGNLDERVREILNTGAKPFFSLSYMPPIFTQTGSVVDKPTNYIDWQNLVQATVEHYSGRNGFNLPFVYYEVWNEPDLFGKMSPSEYFLIYKHAVLGATKAAGVSQFKIGGPATIGVNRTWINTFLGLVKSNNLRLDFVSWHTYGLNPNKVKKDSQTIDSLVNYQIFSNRLEKLVTEWSSDSEMSSIHDSYFDCAHTIATISQSLNSVSKLFAFELKDGLDPEGKTFWGRWGLLTHQEKGAIKKPRYFAFLFLNQLLKYSLPVLTNSSEIYSLASTDGQGNYAILASNFPLAGSTGNQTFSLKITNFLPGEFLETISFLDPSGNSSLPETKFSSLSSIWEKSFSLPAYSTALVTLIRISSATTKTQGLTENLSDFSAHLVAPMPPLVHPFFPSLFETVQSGAISFSIKPTWKGTDPGELFFFETRASPSVRFFAFKKDSDGLVGEIELVFENGSSQKILTADISQWQANQWHQLSFAWDNIKMELNLRIDNQEYKETLGVINPVLPGKFIYLGSDFEGKKQINANLDNLAITINNQLIVSENFD